MNHSIIIPTYNRSQSIERAIQSVVDQTVLRDSIFINNQTIELLIIDDGSTDSTEEKVINFIKQKNGLKITYKYQDHKGVSVARNFGVEQSIGEWIYFLDSDDEWLPTKLEVQIAFHTYYSEILISQTEEFWIRNGLKVNQHLKHKKLPGNIFKESLYQCMITPSSVCLHRQIWNQFKGFDPNLKSCEDYDLWLKITNSENIGLINEKLLNRYGGHKDQLSYLYMAMDRFRLYSMLNGWELWKNKEAVHEGILEKCKILKNGLIKRQKSDLIINEIVTWVDEYYPHPPIKKWLEYCIDDSYWT